MKRVFSLLLALLLIGSTSLTASADILWEPVNNDYYNYEKADTVARIYDVPAGMTVNVYASPEDGRLLTVLEAGARVYVGFSQSVNGELWGVGYPLGNYDTEGWFRLGRLQLEYDHESFMEDFGSQLTYDAPVYSIEDLTGDIPTWTYPGSGILNRTLELQWFSQDYNDGKLEFQQVYTDAAGGRWGYIGYYMGRCGWAYLTDLYRTDPPAFPQEAPNTVTDTAPTEEAPTGVSLPAILLLISAVVLVSGVLIVILKKRHSSQRP